MQDIVDSHKKDGQGNFLKTCMKVEEKEKCRFGQALLTFCVKKFTRKVTRAIVLKKRRQDRRRVKYASRNALFFPPFGRRGKRPRLIKDSGFAS